MECFINVDIMGGSCVLFLILSLLGLFSSISIYCLVFGVWEGHLKEENTPYRSVILFFFLSIFFFFLFFLSIFRSWRISLITIPVIHGVDQSMATVKIVAAIYVSLRGPAMKRASEG